MRVLIAGAGLSGLSTAKFLGLHGVPSLVVERHAITSLRADGREVSTVELFGRGFVVLTSSQYWVDQAVSLGLASCLLEDSAWAKAYGVTESGAVLVRPDFFVAWRTLDASGDLSAVLRRITGEASLSSWP